MATLPRKLKTKFSQFVLKDKKPIRTEDIKEWGKFMESKERILKQDVLKNNFWVSTVFLGIEHRFIGKGKPVLFETMAFDKKGGSSVDERRYTTYTGAMLGHKNMVKKWQKGEELLAIINLKE